MPKQAKVTNVCGRLTLFLLHYIIQEKTKRPKQAKGTNVCGRLTLVLLHYII
jgi:hypothetical protein